MSRQPWYHKDPFPALIWMARLALVFIGGGFVALLLDAFVNCLQWGCK